MKKLNLPFRPSAPVALAFATAAALAAGLVFLPVVRSRWWLAVGLVLAVGVHVGLGRVVKVLLTAFAPLANGAPEVAAYERSVYGTPGRQTLEVVGLVALAGLLIGLGITLGTGWAVLGGFVALAAALALDVRRWERVAASVDWVWFQRGFGQRVHQVAVDHIRDISIHEEDAGGFTVRHGTRNRVCRLNLRLDDKRVVALPKTSAVTHLDQVEAVANHVRYRRQLIDEQAARRGNERPAPARGLDPVGAATPVAVDEREMLRALKQLRRDATRDGVPTLQSEIRPPPHG